ncbi:MAG TPA: alpha/beta hydrolase [Gemmatimonadaceae bacterium]
MSKLQPLQFYFMHFMFMHFMPYPDVAPGRPQGQWVDIPNRRFDPKIRHKLYKEYIDELVLADRLGYDGLVVNEHHATFYSLMPSCSVIAGTLAMLTWLKWIRVPTLILWGTKDRITPVEQAKVWTSLISTSEIETFEGAGHLLFFEAPKAVDRLG